jgi:hypothetical protein
VLRCNLASKPVGEAYLTVRPDKRTLHLCAPADPCAEVSRISESVRPIYLSDFWGTNGDYERSRIYGLDRALAIFQSKEKPGSSLINATEIVVPANLIAEDRITFGCITSSTVATACWIVDPERGRILPPANCFEPFAVRYYQRLEGDVATDAEEVLRVRLSEHVPMEARAGVVLRS